ncbi:hypothetical protein ACF0H5_008910 [Mactra antiquata]
MPLIRASEKFRVPARTLRRHRDKKVRKPGVIQMGRYLHALPEMIEVELRAHVVSMEKRMFGLQMRDVQRLAFDVADKSGVEHPFNKEKRIAGKDWVQEISGGGIGEREISGGCIGDREISGGGIGEIEISGGGIGEREISGGGIGEREISGGGIGEREISGGGIGEREISGEGIGERHISGWCIDDKEIDGGGIDKRESKNGFVRKRNEIVSNGDACNSCDRVNATRIEQTRIRNLIHNCSPLPKLATKRPRSRKAEKSTLLTSSPYKQMMLDKISAKSSSKTSNKKTKIDQKRRERLM